jgi:hypothetical protein
MVVLVRCSNETYTLALEAHLDKLISDGLIVAYLKDGRWIPSSGKSMPPRITVRNRKNLITAMVSCF